MPRKTGITCYGELLAAEPAARTLTYRLLPYGKPGRTNRGTITAGPGSVRLPKRVDLLYGNVQHDRDLVASRFESITEDDEGLIATVRALPTKAGDDLLAEADAGSRTGISVELGDVTIRDGELVGADLLAAGHVVKPAFAGADLVAEDTEPDDQDENTDDVDDVDDEDQEDEDMPKPNTRDDVDETDAGGDVTAAHRGRRARVPAGGAGTRGKAGRKKAARTADEHFTELAAAFAGGEPDTDVLAALDQGVEADLIESSAPQWLDEVWSSRTHRQRFIPLFSQEPLNSLRGVGWRFAETTSAVDPAGTLAVPTVAAYAGYPAEPNSTEVKTEAVDWKADRLAGANEFDREFVDFDTPGFWRGFYRESGNDASRKLDAAGLAHMLNGANHTTLSDASTSATIDEKTAVRLIVAGVLQIQERARPDFALIGTNLWRPMLMTERQAALEYLSVALGLDPSDGTLNQFQLVPSSDAALAGKVLVGSRESQTFYGPKLVRARTVNIANGGIADGLFVYHKEFTGDRYSKVLVTPTGA